MKKTLIFLFLLFPVCVFGIAPDLELKCGTYEVYISPDKNSQNDIMAIIREKDEPEGVIAYLEQAGPYRYSGFYGETPIDFSTYEKDWKMYISGMDDLDCTIKKERIYLDKIPKNAKLIDRIGCGKKYHEVIIYQIDDNFYSNVNGVVLAMSVEIKYREDGVEKWYRNFSHDIGDTVLYNSDSFWSIQVNDDDSVECTNL